MSETKWKSQLFSEHHTKKNKNILAFNMKNKIKNIKSQNNNIDNIESLKTIDDNVSIDDNDNIKEGLFNKNEFTGYDWDDPTHTGMLQDAHGGFTDMIQEIYDASVYFITYTSETVVDKSGDEDAKKKDEEEFKHNVTIVRKYVGMVFCLIASYYSVYNWYYITTYRNEVDGKRPDIIEFLTQRKNTNDDFYGLSDDFYNSCNKGGLKGALYSILYFFLEYVIKIFDEFNSVFLDVIPSFISSNAGKLVTFILLFVFIFNIFYYGAEQVKDMFISLLTGEGFGVCSSLFIIYVLIKIFGSMLSSDPNKHYFSDWEWIGKTFAPTGIIGAIIFGCFFVYNVLRCLLVFAVTMFWTPIIIGLSILIYSFFAIIAFGESNGVLKTFKAIDSECLSDYKVKQQTVCDKYTFLDWIRFFLMTGCKFFYDSILNSSFIFVFITAIYDYYANIKGSTLKNNLIAYSGICIFAALSSWFYMLANAANSNLKKAGFLDANKHEFEFDEVKLNKNKNDLLYSINKKAAELNNIGVNELF